MAALVLRIKFPPTYPLIYKTLRIDANLTVSEAVVYIAETLNIPTESTIGLYLPDEKRWLDDDTPLSSYDSLQDVEHIEYKSKTKSGDDSSQKKQDCACTIL
eukprot:TRINITY_DN19180_c0_g1_i1.p1 TRINITY_DN19180_c0_g1~~TRINITY_DN19180_c0_g1_i1.p1  ORF type:complete len:102 (-),score=21.67 TRINITY_DN19180_c0_g1_i1:234-539(-)